MPAAPTASPADDAHYMHLALQQAALAAAAGEVPVGAVVVRGGVVVGQGRNRPIEDRDPSAHAEIVALRDAAQHLDNYRLEDCTLYVTLEPCAMCCGALLHARVQRVVFAAHDEKGGCAGSVLNLFDQTQLNHQTRLCGGVLAEMAAQQLQGFFQERRQSHKARAVPLREDALRTPDSAFASLPPTPWPAHYLTDLPGLAGLRMHYLDAGSAQGQPVLLGLHAADSWSHAFGAQIALWVAKGARMLVPDLIGFGRSDKPKRASAHSVEFHVQYLLEWLARLGSPPLQLLLPEGGHPLARALVQQSAARITHVHYLAAQALAMPAAVCHAPYPDAGHCAAARAFATWPLQAPIIAA